MRQLPEAQRGAEEKGGALQNHRSKMVPFIFLIKNQYDIVSMDTLTPYFIKSQIPSIVKHTGTYH